MMNTTLAQLRDLKLAGMLQAVEFHAIRLQRGVKRRPSDRSSKDRNGVTDPYA